VETRQVAHGLWRWTALHPLWGEEVGCVYFEAAGATVLIDPLVPAGEEEQFFRHLDADVERRGLPVVILLTCEWHRRSTDQLAERYGARVGGELPDGIEEIPIEGADERQAAYFIRPHQALVVAEIFATDSGDLEVRPTPALERPEELEESLNRLLALPVERLLAAHGQPLLNGATGRMS